MIVMLLIAVLMLIGGANCILISCEKGKYGKILIENIVNNKLNSSIHRNVDRKDIEKETKFFIRVIGVVFAIGSMLAFINIIFNNGKTIIIQ